MGEETETLEKSCPKTETDNSQRKESKLPTKLSKSRSDSQAAKENQTTSVMRHPSSSVTLANDSKGGSFQCWQECGESGGHRPCDTPRLLQPLRELTSRYTAMKILNACPLNKYLHFGESVLHESDQWCVKGVCLSRERVSGAAWLEAGFLQHCSGKKMETTQGCQRIAY